MIAIRTVLQAFELGEALHRVRRNQPSLGLDIDKVARQLGRGFLQRLQERERLELSPESYLDEVVVVFLRPYLRQRHLRTVAPSSFGYTAAQATNNCQR